MVDRKMNGLCCFTRFDLLVFTPIQILSEINGCYEIRITVTWTRYRQQCNRQFNILHLLDWVRRIIIYQFNLVWNNEFQSIPVDEATAEAKDTSKQTN